MNFVCPVCKTLGTPHLCHKCTGKLYKMLHTIAMLVPELDNELTKQTAKVSKMQRAGGSSTPLVYSPEASDLTQYAWTVLDHWLRRSGWNGDVPTLTLLAATAYYQYHRLARLIDADVMFTEMTSLRDALVALADLPIEKVFLGVCETCQQPIHADPTETHVECRCGAQMDTQAAKTAISDELRASWLTPKETRDYVKGKGGVLGSQVLSNWGAAKKVRKQVIEGQSFYHLGDVLAYAEERGLFLVH